MIHRKLALLSALTLLPSYFANAATYEIDTQHASAHFSVRHLMVSNVRGEFAKIKGTIEYDPANPSAAKVEATIDANSVDTREQKRDDHLRSPDFLDTQKFPTIIFTSKKVEEAGPGKLKVTGDLTIRGVTKSVVLDVDGPTAEIKDPWGKTRMGAQATAKINRKDFGVVWNKVLETGGLTVGDEVAITIDVELVKQADKT